MATAMLAPAGYRPDAKEKPARDTAAGLCLGLLAALARRRADELDETPTT
jgi:hypothetical protein